MIATLSMLGAAIAGVGFHNARADPIVRRTSIGLPYWPEGAAPIRIVLTSDIHIGNAVTRHARLARIVEQINALRPDLIVVAGDFITSSGRENAQRGVPMLAPPTDLRAPLGVVAVLGNHDSWTDAPLVARSLTDLSIPIVVNDAIKRGPVVIGGLGDQPTGHAKPAAMLAAMDRLAGAKMVLAHSPDIAPALPPNYGPVLAGHTHCGQIVLPLIGAVADVSRFHGRYECGVVREGRRTTIVTAGVGTSVAPFRCGAPPDLWVIQVGPERRQPSRSRS